MAANIGLEFFQEAHIKFLLRRSSVSYRHLDCLLKISFKFAFEVAVSNLCFNEVGLIIINLVTIPTMVQIFIWLTHKGNLGENRIVTIFASTWFRFL